MPRKLTPGEISASVEKIRKKYDDYIAKFFKPRTLRRAFESRYIQALRARVDISSFLLAEIAAIQELTEREEQRVQLGPVRPASTEKPQSFADKVLEENRARIGKYPDLPFHPDASEEVRRMAGALTQLAEQQWVPLGGALEDTMYAMSSSEMLAMDSQLRYLCSPGGNEAPQFLNRLLIELKKFPRHYPSIDREEKDYILESSFFLHDLFMMLERVKRVYTDMAEARRNVVQGCLDYVWTVITDFRLKDLKRGK
ncbi:MAG TPA: hypothetical protein VMF68_02725 [Spirochaetia bacterium]|nr:hypothetical protein [Spirochaetia bacterium]